MTQQDSLKKNILLTGATGFVGPCLIDTIKKSDKLSSANIVVWGYDPADQSGNNPHNIDIRKQDDVDFCYKRFAT